MTKRTAIKNDLFASQYRRDKIDELGDPLDQLASHIDFTAFAERVEHIAPRPDSSQGGRSAWPTETMVRVLVIKRLYNLSDEQVEYPILDRMSLQRLKRIGKSYHYSRPNHSRGVWESNRRSGSPRHI